MDKIEVNEMDNKFQVIVGNGAGATSHEVAMTDDYYQKLTQKKISKKECIEASFRFLLEREPKEAILKQFELPVISHYFPDFERQFQEYL